MDLREGILTRRSIRAYTDEPISHAQLEEIITLASYAPTWKNTQISRYIAIEDITLREEICKRFVPNGNNAKMILAAPVVIAQTFIKSRSGFERDGSFSTDRGDGWQYYDCGIACQSLCLAAHSLGLGTVVMGVFDRRGVQEFLKLPEDQELMALIALGHPAETPIAPKRKTVEALLTYR